MLIGLLAIALCPKALTQLGIFDYGIWFLDSYAILAASDTRAAGADPVQPMAYDVQNRAHIYSDWWYGVGKLGLTRDDNFLLGGLWVIAFFTATWLLLKPKSGRETAWYLALFLAPPVLLGINRANNDLVIFVLLALAAGVLARFTLARCAAALGALVLATGLKYYPVAGAMVFLLVQPRARLLKTVCIAAGVLALTLISVAPALGRANLNGISVSIYTFGAPVIFRDLGLEGPAALVGGAVVLAMLVGVSLWWRPLGSSTSTISLSTPNAAFVLGSAVLVACFLTGISFGYRCLFLLLVAPWLWEHRNRRIDVRLGVWLATIVLWMDGLSCLVMNLGISHVDRATSPVIQYWWRMLTQPIVWVLVALLARWLVEIMVAAWRNVRTEKAFTPTPG
jgi:hypothetical protein